MLAGKASSASIVTNFSIKSSSIFFFRAPAHSTLSNIANGLWLSFIIFQASVKKTFKLLGHPYNLQFIIAPSRADFQFGAYWIFSCDNTASPAGRKPPVRTNGNRLCEFTRVMFCLSHIPHALRCHVRHQCLWYWYDNCHGQYDQWLHLPKNWHRHLVGHTIPRTRTGNRKS